MSNYWSKLLIIAGFLSLLTGCEQLDKLVAKNLGKFQGMTSDGRVCEVAFFKSLQPAVIGSTAIYLSLKVASNDQHGGATVKVVGQGGSAIVGRNSFIIAQGTMDDPKLVSFAGETLIAFSNQLAHSIRFQSGEDCTNMIKQ